MAAAVTVVRTRPALEFLKERGCLEVERRRCFPSSDAFFEDALCEWHALAFQCETEMDA